VSAAKSKRAAKKRVARKPAAAKKTTRRASAVKPAGKVALGTRVADFSLPGSGAQRWRLADARGRKLVLYFYPRDNTPGCTIEAQQFAALAQRFEQAGIALVGISRDSAASHDKFSAQQRLPFPLLSDVDGKLCAQFDVIREKNLYGRKVMGIERSTFLLDAAQVLRQEWRRVKVEGHALAVLTAAQAL